LQALSVEANGAVESGVGSGRRLTALYENYGSGPKALTDAQKMSKRKGVPTTEGGKGPSSLFIFSEDNIIRRHIKFIIEPNNKQNRQLEKKNSGH
ncbi:hypothetical protein B4U79_09381, partial [Dinothrombium tinctorium]